MGMLANLAPALGSLRKQTSSGKPTRTSETANRHQHRRHSKHSKH